MDRPRRARCPGGAWARPSTFRWLHGIVKTVLVLNLLDAIFTLVWVRFGYAREAN
jgi:hypothetical protein